MKRPAPLAVAAALAALALLYGPLVLRDPVLSRDDRTLLGGVASLSSPLSWAAAVRSGAVLDLQPVRDLSLWLDLRLGALLGHGVHHLVNVLLFACLLILLYRLLRALGVREGVAAAVVLVACVHPLFAGSVAWISARKHLLAAVFTLGATVAFLRGMRTGSRRALSGAGLLWAAGALSQPIVVLWPGWAAGWAWWLGRAAADSATDLVPEAASGSAPVSTPPPEILAPHAARGLLSALSLIPLSASVLVANFVYYKTIYVQVAGAKLIEADGSESVPLLAAGRALVSLLCPLWLSPLYDPGRPQNLIGLLLLPVAGPLLWRGLGRAALPWVALAALMLAPVLGRATNIFLSDTYLLLPAACCAVLGALWLERRALPGWPPVVLTALLCAGLSLLALREARAWSSDAALWARAWDEGAPLAGVRHASLLLRAGKPSEAREVIASVEARAPQTPQLASVRAQLVASEPALPLAEKVILVERETLLEPWVLYWRGTLRFRAGRREEGAADLLAALRNPRALGEEVSVVAAEGAAMCALAREAAGAGVAGDCDLPRALGARSPAFSAARYEQRLRGLTAR